MKSHSVVSIRSIILALVISVVFLPEIDAQKDTVKQNIRKITNYYIASGGDDNNPGTNLLPWKTIDKANRILQSGDTVTFYEGSYSGIINPSSSGKNYVQAITYRSEKKHQAILNGDKNSKYVINLNDKRFIVIDGFKILPAQGGFGYIRDCDHITLENCHMEGSSKVYCPLEFIDGDYNRLLYNNIIRVIQRTTDSKIHGDGCHFINSSYNLIEGNDFSKVGHCPLRIWSRTAHHAKFNIIRGNCFHNSWGRNFEMFNLDRSLFENNIITDAFNGAMSGSARAKVFFTDGIFRNCLIYENWDVALFSDSYFDVPTTGNVRLELNNTRIYNNTFANNPSYLWTFSGSQDTIPVRSNIFMNNIFFNNDYEGSFLTLSFSQGCGEDNLFYNNLFYGIRKNQAGIKIYDRFYNSSSMNKNLSVRAEDNMDADPRFISLDDHLFIPGKYSPAINSGCPLTRTTGKGSGNRMTVKDARCFFDGFGIEGEQGDLIVVGKNKTMARVLQADINKNSLLLDRKINWVNGDPVSLPFSGKGPDLGAYQTGNEGILTAVACAQPVHAETDQNISFTALISGSRGKVYMEWDLGDGTNTDLNSPQHKYENYNNYTVRLRCTDESGAEARSMTIVKVERSADPGSPLIKSGFEEEDFEEWGHQWDRGPSREQRNTYYPDIRDDGKGQCMCVSTEGNNKTLAVTLKMRIWDIDKYPWLSFSYRIPRGVPVGVWLNPWPSENRPSKICVGGSRENSSGKFKNINGFTLEDDGMWHDITIDARIVRKLVPDIKLLHVFEFSTNAPSVPGQKFWFDDFEIKPSYE